MALFENDGCTLFPDQWNGKSLAECCAVHDEAMATGTTLQEFWSASTGLFNCVRVEVSLGLAIVMFLGVVTLGILFFVLGSKRPRDTDQP